MKQIFKIILRIFALFAFLLLSNWVYSHFFLEQDLQRYSSVVNNVRELDSNTLILYLGESSNSSFDRNDLDKRKISQMLEDFYPGLIIRDITVPGAHLGLYHSLLSQLPDDSVIETVVVTLNLRSFGQDWMQSKSQYEYEKSQVLLKPYPALSNRFLLSFKHYSAFSEKVRKDKLRSSWKEEQFDTTMGLPYTCVYDWDKGMALKGIRDSLGNYQQDSTELACHYIKSYAFTMNAQNRQRLAEIDDIIALAREKNWQLVFNLMAENVQRARLLVGEDLEHIMKANRDYLLDYLSDRSIKVVDNFEAIDDEEFIDKDWTTEHYRQKGRRIIAQRLARTVQAYHPDAFIPADNNYPEVPIFFHDAEQNYNWGQAENFNEEYAYSGRRSIKVDDSHPYGFTFICSMDQIPEKNRNAMELSLMASGKSQNPSPKLVVDMILKNGQNQWNGYSIHSTSPGKWVSFEQKINLPPDAQNLKIYVLNDSEIPLFVDDFRISFY